MYKHIAITPDYNTHCIIKQNAENNSTLINSLFSFTKSRSTKLSNSYYQTIHSLYYRCHYYCTSYLFNFYPWILTLPAWIFQLVNISQMQISLGKLKVHSYYILCFPQGCAANCLFHSLAYITAPSPSYYIWSLTTLRQLMASYNNLRLCISDTPLIILVINHTLTLELDYGIRCVFDNQYGTESDRIAATAHTKYIRQKSYLIKDSQL